MVTNCKEEKPESSGPSAEAKRADAEVMARIEHLSCAISRFKLAKADYLAEIFSAHLERLVQDVRKN